MAAARAVASGGRPMLRGGAFKPRTSPYAFQGLGVEGLKMLAAARDETGLPIVTEVMDPRDLDDLLELRRRRADRRPQHAELPAPVRGGALRASPCCSSAACPPRSRSGSWPPSTSSRRATAR